MRSHKFYDVRVYVVSYAEGAPVIPSMIPFLYKYNVQSNKMSTLIRRSTHTQPTRFGGKVALLKLIFNNNISVQNFKREDFLEVKSW